MMHGNINIKECALEVFIITALWCDDW